MKLCKLHISESNEPVYNLALEEWALQNADTQNCSYLILYVNKPSVIVGRNQNLFEEVNLSYCQANNISIARRISGGGTVFHDYGNLNWSFISAFDTKKVNNYDWASQMLLELLKGYGLAPYLTERNAIEVAGVKLTGQAQFTNRKNILSHGTLLVNSDLKKLQPAIEIPQSFNITSKASKSVRSTTENLSSLLQKNLQVKDVIRQLQNSFDFELEPWNDRQVDSAKLQKDSWLYGRSPKFKVSHRIGKLMHEFSVEKGVVQTITNEKGHLLKDSPFLNLAYEKYLEQLNH